MKRTELQTFGVDFNYVNSSITPMKIWSKESVLYSICWRFQFLIIIVIFYYKKLHV